MFALWSSALVSGFTAKHNLLFKSRSGYIATHNRKQSTATSIKQTHLQTDLGILKQSSQWNSGFFIYLSNNKACMFDLSRNVSTSEHRQQYHTFSDVQRNADYQYWNHQCLIMRWTLTQHRWCHIVYVLELHWLNHQLFILCAASVDCQQTVQQYWLEHIQCNATYPVTCSHNTCIILLSMFSSHPVSNQLYTVSQSFTMVTAGCAV